MKLTLLGFKFRLFLVMLTAAFSLIACASNPLTVNCLDNTRVTQAFSFGMRESPEIEILDYFYGVPNCPSIRNPDQFKMRGESMQGENQIGLMRRAQELYVKWRIKATGHEHEDTVDLRSRLPKDMTNNRIHFSVKNSQLYVYLVTRELRPPDMPPNGPREFKDYKTLTIYPDGK